MVVANPKKLAQGVVVQHVGTETLVYDERRHQAFCLNATSAAVWNLCDGTRAPDQIAAASARVLAAPIPVALVEFALAELRRDGLLEPGSALPPSPLVSRRAMMQSLGATSVLLVPAVAVILAPRAAQAYSGCFNCSTSSLSAGQRKRILNSQNEKAQDNQTKQRPPNSFGY